MTEQFWKSFKETVGAFSTAECIALYNIAIQAPEGMFVELGSHKGKSTHAISLAASERKDKGFLMAVEPEFKDNKWRSSFIGLIGGMLPESSFGYYIGGSLDFIPEYDDYAFVFIDSGLHDDMVMDEVKLLEDKILPSGIIAFHDFLNQFTAVERAYKYLLSTGKYEEIIIDWQPIFDYIKEHNLEEGNNSWHQYPELPHPPNFVGALRRL